MGHPMPSGVCKTFYEAASEVLSFTAPIHSYRLWSVSFPTNPSSFDVDTCLPFGCQMPLNVGKLTPIVASFTRYVSCTIYSAGLSLSCWEGLSGGGKSKRVCVCVSADAN